MIFTFGLCIPNVTNLDPYPFWLKRLQFNVGLITRLVLYSRKQIAFCVCTMASSHSVHGDDVHTGGATDGTDVIGPLSGLFTTTMESQIQSEAINNDDNDNGQNIEHVVIDNHLTQASAATGSIGKSNTYLRAVHPQPADTRILPLRREHKSML